MVEKGRVLLHQDADEWIDMALARAPMKEAPLTNEIVRASRQIDLPHPDPADRFIAATAKVLGLTLVTADQRLLQTKDLSVLAGR